MSNLAILKWGPFEYAAKLEKRLLFFRSKIYIFDIYFKRLWEERFEDLQIVIENVKPVPLRPCKVFAKLHESPLLIANIVKGAIPELRLFFATESP